MITKILGLVFVGILVLLLLITLVGSWGTVDAGNVGVVLRMGAVTGELKQPGFYTKLPLITKVESMNTQVQKEQVDTESVSADVQVVNTTLSLNLSLMADKAAVVYQNIGVNYLQSIVHPAMQESAKAIMAKFTAVELVSKREQVRDEITQLLKSKLSSQGINIETVNIVNMSFSPSFNQAIEAKVTAEQNALAAKNKLEQIKYEAEQNVAKADGEAKAITAQALAIQSAGGAAYIQLKALEKWDGKLPQIVGSGAVPFINTTLTK